MKELTFNEIQTVSGGGPLAAFLITYIAGKTLNWALTPETVYAPTK